MPTVIIVPIQAGYSILSQFKCDLANVHFVFQAHTAYVAGVRETDVHIEYFWNSMESFSQV